MSKIFKIANFEMMELLKATKAPRGALYNRKMRDTEERLQEDAVATTEPTADDNIMHFEGAVRILQCLTVTQRKIATMKADGYTLLEIGGTLGMTVEQVTAELTAAQENIIRMAPDLVGLAA